VYLVLLLLLLYSIVVVVLFVLKQFLMNDFIPFFAKTIVYTLRERDFFKKNKIKIK